MRRTLLLALALSSACATVRTTGTFANPARPGPTPAPSVGLHPVSCEGPDVEEKSGEPAAVELDAQLSARFAATWISAQEDAARALCDALASDRALYSDLVFGTEWSVTAPVAQAVRQLAASHGAGSVLVPLVRARPSCASAKVTDSYSRPPERLAFDATCPVHVDLALFVFDADGTLAWKTTATAGESELETPTRVSNQLVGELPKPAAGAAVAKDGAGQ